MVKCTLDLEDPGDKEIFSSLGTYRDCLVEAAEDGHNVRHVKHPLVLTAEAVCVKSLDRDVERQEVN